MAEADWKYLQYNIETGQKRTGDGPSGGASSLSDLDDTSISNPSDGQMLGYDETEGKWKNVNAPAGSVSDVQLDNESVVDQNGVAKLTTPNIDALGKTAISNPADGEMLGYDETEGKWKNVAAPGGNVDDVEVNGVSVVNAQKVAKITSYKEVTQAQYEALPDTKLSDNILYAIKDGGQAVDGFPPLIYSDEEREVGVWRDGKPIYQRAFVLSNSLIISNTAWTSMGILASSINAESYIRCFALSETGTLWDAMNVATIDSYIALTSWRNGDTIAVKTVVIQYTKTTDTPGSGTWTTQGALAHHYSTEEHIIGTWIDGKPLYEKTKVFSDISKSGSLSFGVTNAESVFVCDIGKGSVGIPLPYVHGSAPSNNIGGFLTISANDVTWEFRSGNDAPSTLSGFMTIRYTKTTD